MHTNFYSFFVLLFWSLLLAWNAPVSAQRQTINEELLSGLIQAKQEEIRSRALRNFVRDGVSKNNIATYNRILEIMDVLLTQKNSTVMTKSLLRIMGEHGISYAITWDFLERHCASCRVDELFAYDIRQRLDGTADTTHVWTTLLQKYVDSAASTKASEAAERSPQAELHSWVLDTVSNYLRSIGRLPTPLHKNLYKIGFFVKNDPWDGSMEVRYAEMWRGIDTNVAKSIRSELMNYLDKLSLAAETGQALGTTLEKLARHIGTDHTEGFPSLDLTSIGQYLAGGDSTRVVQNKPVRALVQLFRKSVEIYRYAPRNNRFIARFADIIDQYIILDPDLVDPNSRYGFTIDIEGIILSLEDHMELKGSISRQCIPLHFYFTIGANYGANDGNGLGFDSEVNNGFRTIAWAGEKVGLKWRFSDFKYTRNQPMGEVYQYHGTWYRRMTPPEDPMVSNLYANLYASGLIYTVADLRSDKSFNQPIIGGGLGMTWFNGLETNLSYVVPVLNGNFNAGFWNIGLDVPIFEYIKAAREKRR